MVYLKEADRASLIIDGTSLFLCAKALGFHIDYKRLLELFAGKCRLREARYYTVANESPDEFNPLTPLLDWVEFNGFLVTTKPPGERRGSIAPEMTVAMMRAATYSDVIILASGDRDMCAAVDAVQDMGTPVIILSSLAAQVVADDLRRAAAEFMEIKDLQSRIARPADARTAPKP